MGTVQSLSLLCPYCPVNELPSLAGNQFFSLIFILLIFPQVGGMAPPPPCPPFAAWPPARPLVPWHHPQSTPLTPPGGQAEQAAQASQSSAGCRGARYFNDTGVGGKQETDGVVIEVEECEETEGTTTNQK